MNQGFNELDVREVLEEYKKQEGEEAYENIIYGIEDFFEQSWLSSETQITGGMITLKYGKNDTLPHCVYQLKKASRDKLFKIIFPTNETEYISTYCGMSKYGADVLYQEDNIEETNNCCTTVTLPVDMSYTSAQSYGICRLTIDIKASYYVNSEDESKNLYLSFRLLSETERPIT